MKLWEIVYLLICFAVPIVSIVVLGILDMRLQDAAVRYGESVIRDAGALDTRLRYRRLKRG